MKVLFVEAGKFPVEKEISESLESMQELVGGTIEAIYPFDDPVALICNEEGKLLNLPMCRSLHEAEDIICGSFFICGAPSDSENFTSLTPEQMKRIRQIYQIADQNEKHYGIVNFEKTSLPEIFEGNGERREFDWTAVYDGSRSQLSWMQ